MLYTNIPRAKGIRLKDLPVGSFVKDLATTYYGKTIIWRIADKNHEGYPDNSVTLTPEKILSIKPFDGCEPSNPTAYCSVRGNSRYIHSNIRCWANSAAGPGEWYLPQHAYDTPPVSENLQSQRNAYYHEAGFLNGFSKKFYASLMPTTLTALVSDTYGGGEDSFTDRIFLASLAELGLQNTKKIDEGLIMAMFTNRENVPAKPTEACVAHSEYVSASLNTEEAHYWWTRSAYTRDAYSGTYIISSGSNASTMAYYSTIGFRPFCNLPGSTRVSLAPDADGAYVMFA